MATDAEVKEWWARLSDAQQHRLTAAAAEHDLDDAEVSQLLAETNCPVGPVHSGWETDSGSSSSEPTGVLPEYVRDFILQR